MAMPSDEVQKSAASGESGDPADQQGGPAGHATSDPSEDAELQLGTPTTLEVQLEIARMQLEQAAAEIASLKDTEPADLAMVEDLDID